MIPEFNLRDWRDPLTNAPFLPHGLNREWLAVLDEAQSALADRDFARATQLAQRLIEIDGGLCVAGYYILADCSRAANDIDGERSEEHTSELQSHSFISYAVFCLNK